MSNDPLQVAQSRLAYHEGEAAKLREFLDMYQRLASATEPLLEAVDRRDELPPASTQEIIDGAVAVLEAKGAAMTAAAIYEGLVEAGIRVNGRSPKGNMTAKFSQRRDLLTYSSASNKWALVKWDVSSPPPRSGFSFDLGPAVASKGGLPDVI